MHPINDFYRMFFKQASPEDGIFVSLEDEKQINEISEAAKAALYLKLAEDMKEDGPDFTFNMWFKDLKLVHIVGSNCTLSTTTNLRKNIIQRKYRDILEFAFSEALGESCKVYIFSEGEIDEIIRFYNKETDSERYEAYEKRLVELGMVYTDPKDPTVQRSRGYNDPGAVEYRRRRRQNAALRMSEEVKQGVEDYSADPEEQLQALSDSDGRRDDYSVLKAIERMDSSEDIKRALTEEPTPRDDKDKVKTEKTAESAEGDKDEGELSSPKRPVIDTYTFENFVEGSSNKFAKAACMAVAKYPTTYNPLFIYGNSGLGKTHLLNAVVHYMRENHPNLKIVYKKCEKFLDELIKALKNDTIPEFKEYYRSCDVLLIDDVQFLAGKVQTQEEFFHTFSTLYESEKQIILTSDRPPKEIKPLEDRLLTRFEGGVLADVQPPNFELRLAIIEKKAEDMNLKISAELIEYMAERLQNNIRQIEGLLKRIYAVSSLTAVEITKKSIDDAISVIDPGNIPTDTLIERILIAVSKEYGVSVEELKSTRKTDNVAGARHVAIYIIKKETDLSLKKIGAIFNRNHATVISSIEKVSGNIRTVNNYESTIERIIKEVRG